MDPQLQLEFTEEWRQVIGYEGYYEVSNLGRVRSVARAVNFENGRILHYQGKITRVYFNAGGYLRVHLNRDNKSREHKVHSIVASAFIGPRPPGMQIDHKDGCKTNNAPSNLEYVTGSENIKRSFARGTHPITVRDKRRLFQGYGELSNSWKLTDVQVIEIRRLYKEGMKQTELADMFRVTQGTISRIINSVRRSKPTQKLPWKPKPEGQE